jgi:protein involved in polysaccharide export with SLBB domain
LSFRLLRQARSVVLVLLLAETLAGCDGVEMSAEPCVGIERHEIGPGGATGPLEVRAGDKLRISVYGEAQLTGDYFVDPGGSLSMPLVGTVPVAGMTKAELERLLTERLRRAQYVIDPKVTVDIASFRPFYVLGEVERPGEYPYQGGLNVEGAVAVAGGHTYRASESRILIQRLGDTGYRECPRSPKILVYPGDVVRLPERYF